MAGEYAAKPLKQACLQMDGISAEQITQHYELLYKGYVNKVNEVWQKYGGVDKSKANQSYSDLRALKVGESFALDGAKLHEYYFDNLGGAGSRPGARVEALIERDFGSHDAYVDDLKMSGMAVRGWVVTAYDPDLDVVRNYGQDAHDVGVIVRAQPLLVLDVYEHAYGIDYGTKRPPYLEAFVKNIDWDEVEKRAAALGL
jgi:Fe-Mn family superoxide dismutase